MFRNIGPIAVDCYAGSSTLNVDGAIIDWLGRIRNVQDPQAGNTCRKICVVSTDGNVYRRVHPSATRWPTGRRKDAHLARMCGISDVDDMECSCWIGLSASISIMRSCRHADNIALNWIDA